MEKKDIREGRMIHLEEVLEVPEVVVVREGRMFTPEEDAEDSVVLVIAENGNKSRRGHCQRPSCCCWMNPFEQRYPHRATTKANRETQHESRNRMCKGGAV